MHRRAVLLFTIALFSLALTQPAHAITVPIEAPSTPPATTGLQALIANFLNGAMSVIASIESSVGHLADGVSNPNSSVPAQPSTSPPVEKPGVAYTAAAAAAVTPTVTPVPPFAPPKPTPSLIAHAGASKRKTAVNFAEAVVTPPVNVFAIQSALGELAARVQALSTLIAAQQDSSPTAALQMQVAALQSALSSHDYDASYIPLGDGSSNTTDAVSNIGQLSGTNISNPTITGGSISNTSISGTTVSGGTVDATTLNATAASSTSLFSSLANFTTAVATTLNASVANIVGFTATNATTTNLAVTGNLTQTSGTSTLAAVNLPNDNCSSYGNGGKLTTDAFGNVICAADQGGSGSTVAGANTQVQFNDGGSFGANSAFTFDKTNARLTVTNASTSNLSVSGNATLGNATSTSLFSTLSNFTTAMATTLNASVANIVGFSATNATTTNLIASNATSTNLYAASAVIPSLTGTKATFSGATTTNLAVTGITSSLLKTASDGAIVAAIPGTDYVASTAGDWTGTFGTFAPSYYLDARNLTNFTTPFASVIAGTTTDALAEGVTNKYFTNARAQAAISVSGTPLTYSSGVIGVSQANASQPGFLASTDWTNFNGKLASTSLSAAEPLTYNSSTGAIAFDLTHANTWTGTQTFGSIAATNATTSSLYVIGTKSALLKTDANGQVVAAVSGTDYQAPITAGNLTVGSNLSVSGGTGAVIGSGASISLGSNVVTGVTNDTNVTGSVVGNNLTLGWTGLLGVGRGGTGSSTLSGILKGNGTSALVSAIGGTDYEFPLTFSSPLSRIGNTISIPQATGSQNGFLASSDWTNFNGKLASSSLATSAVVAGLVSDHTGSGSLAFATSPTFAGTPVFSGGVINDSVNSTTTIPNGTPYAWTVATSTSANPLIEVDSSGTNGAISLGAANASSTSLSLGATGEPATLVFAASSTIEGGGTGQLITIGANADTVDFGGSGNVGIGTSTPTKPLTIDSTNASGTAIRLSNSATGGHIFDLVSTGPGNTGGAGRFDIFDVTSGLARLSIQNSGNVGIGTTTPGSIFSINGVANWTTATSTIYSAGGINIEGGCFSINGTCITGGGGGPTYTFSYPLINTANTISLGFGTTTANSWSQLQTFSAGASTTNLVISNLGNTGTNCLQINNLGQVSSTGSACGGSGSTPGGSSGQIQFNSASTFGGASNLWWDSSNNRLGVGTSSPYAELSVATPVGASGAVTTLFAIASSTSVGTTTLFSVSNTGSIVSTLGTASSTFTVGYNGLTNPAFEMTSPATSPVNGLDLVTTASGSGVSLSTISSATNEPLTISTKGTGNLTLATPGSGSNVVSLSVNGYSPFTQSYTELSLAPHGKSIGNGNVAPELSLVTSADTGLSASTEIPIVQFNFANATRTHANGNIALQRDFLINAPTDAMTSMANGNFTNIATFGIAGAPLMGNFATSTNSHTLYLGGSVLNASTTNSYGLTVNANTGAANNYTAEFLGGNVGIGTTSPQATLEVWGPDAASTSAFTVANNASTTEFTIYDTGNAVLAGSLTQNSDIRLKTNISDLDGSSSLAEIDALNPVTFNWIDPAKSSVPQFGFIAQQVEQVFPNLVATTAPTALTPDGTLSLNYIDLISPIIAAIQELDKEISSLASTVAGFAESFTTNIVNSQQDNTQKLCVGSTCVTPAQFQAMVAAANQTASVPASPSVSAPATGATGTPPVIEINGDNPAVIQVGTSYTDLGANITDPQADLNLGIQTFVDGVAMNPVQIDTSQAATDTIDYVVTDQSGLAATSTRTVIVEAPVAPPAVVDSTASTTNDTATTTGATQ
jgi:hypothetical protein